MKSCPYCAVPMSNPRRVQCGAAECLKAYHRDRNREIQRRLRAEFAARGESYRNQWAKGRERKSNSHCVDCGIPVGHGSTQDTRCRKCWHRNLHVNRRRTRAERRLAAAEAGSRGSRVWTAGDCARCGDPFLIQWPTRHCSKTCARKDRAAERRARQAGAKVTPGRRIAVYERDGWQCQICGDPVNRDAVVPALDAPVIDHRVPLAGGGDHAPHNWQTAHFYCNSVKRDQVDFDFAEVAA